MSANRLMKLAVLDRRFLLACLHKVYGTPKFIFCKFWGVRSVGARGSGRWVREAYPLVRGPINHGDSGLPSNQ